MAQINLDVVLKDTKGKAIPGSDIELGEEMTAKEVVVNSLLSQTSEKVGGLDKHKCYLIYKKVTESKEVILTAEEISGIKSLVDKFYGPLIVGQVYEILEQEVKNTVE